MPRILKKLRECAIAMLNASMTMNAVAMKFGCSTRAIRHPRQRFQATGRRDAWPRPLYSEHAPAQLLRNCHSYCC